MKYDNVRVMNSRLTNTLQADNLVRKLKIFESELNARDKVAQKYTEPVRSV